MPRSLTKQREEARRLFLTGEVETNAAIASRLKVKPHTVGRWHKEEDWDGLRRKVDRRAAEMFADRIASDRVSLNIRHFRMWDLCVAKLAEDLKNKQAVDIRELERIAGILDKAQKGQRLAKGLSMDGETEEAIKAQAEAETRRVVDVFIESVKNNVEDLDARERIRQAIVSSLHLEEDPGAGEPGTAGGD